MDARKLNQGFTLVEVLAACVVLVGAVVIIMQSLSNSVYSSRILVTENNARMVALDKLNRVEAGDNPQLPWDGSHNFCDVRYTWKIQSGDSADGMAENIICSVSWVISGKTHSLEISRSLFGGQSR